MGGEQWIAFELRAIWNLQEKYAFGGCFVCSRKNRYHIVGNFLPSVGLQGKLRQSPGKIFDLDLPDSQHDITCLYTIQQQPLHAPKTKSTDVR